VTHRCRAIALLGATCAAAVSLASPATAAITKGPVSAFSAPGFGKVLGTTKHQALYVFDQEKDKAVHCTGDCVAAWPILYAPASGKVPAQLTGFKGRFGTIKRPENGRLQVTWSGQPVYTYAHEGSGQVKCNNAGGWFVVRASGKTF
jgi:predicted lipoprotein with Yx(FWY)xxD motif